MSKIDPKEKRKMVNVSEALGFYKILQYSGFDDSSKKIIITADGFDSYDETLTLGDSEIVNLSKGFSDRTVSARKISFGLLRTNLLKAAIHWDRYFRSISRTPSLIGISNAAEFCAAIEAARQRDRIRKHSLEESSSLGQAADPVKLKRHKDWITWSREFKNCLSTILGQDGVPLSYVIREPAAPDYAIELQPYSDSEQFSINCVTLTGLT